MTHPLITAWRQCALDAPPFLLPADRAFLDSFVSRPGIAVHRSLAEYTASPEFGQLVDYRLHLGLCPVPFIGPVEAASVYLLMLNPSLSTADYFAEWQEPSFRSALLTNLSGQSGFLGLNLDFAWQSGFSYWHGKLRGVLQCLAADMREPYQVVLEKASRRICALQLLPYRSLSYGVPRQVLADLPSCKLMHDFVRDVAVPRARRGEALVVVTRHAEMWNVPKDCSPVVYSGSAARAAHLTPATEGGRRIQEILLRSMGGAA